MSISLSWFMSGFMCFLSNYHPLSECLWAALRLICLYVYCCSQLSSCCLSAVSHFCSAFGSTCLKSFPSGCFSSLWQFDVTKGRVILYVWLHPLPGLKCEYHCFSRYWTVYPSSPAISKLSLHLRMSFSSRACEPACAKKTPVHRMTLIDCGLQGLVALLNQTDVQKSYSKHCWAIVNAAWFSPRSSSLAALAYFAVFGAC